jgi:hypothetical protein
VKIENLRNNKTRSCQTVAFFEATPPIRVINLKAKYIEELGIAPGDVLQLTTHTPFHKGTTKVHLLVTQVDVDSRKARKKENQLHWVAGETLTNLTFFKQIPRLIPIA